MATASIPNAAEILPELMERRILILDGAMGTMIQRYKLNEEQVRGERFAKHHKDLGNFSDLLCLTHPEKITEIHRQYFAAGADIVETNSFGASPVGMADFDFDNVEDLCREINHAAVRCAKAAAEQIQTESPGRQCFVAGSIGPTSKQMAISTKVDDASFRDTSFDEMVASYRLQVASLDEAGVDILLPETVIDTLNPQGVSVCDCAAFRGGRSQDSSHGVRNL